jgi:hypothetical protein
MLLQFSETSPGIEVRNGNENTSNASRASKLSSNVPGDLPLACFVDPILSVQLLDEDTIGVLPMVYDAILQLMTEAPAFRRYGLPEIIRVDNGAPFASMGSGGLSLLRVWWIGLGIEIEFTRPGCPQDKGCHERMHRTLKADCCQKPSINGAAQQQRFDRWRHEFNHERPHEMLGMQMPCECYQASNVRLNQRIKHRLYEVGD